MQPISHNFIFEETRRLKSQWKPKVKKIYIFWIFFVLINLQIKGKEESNDESHYNQNFIISDKTLKVLNFAVDWIRRKKGQLENVGKGTWDRDLNTKEPETFEAQKLIGFRHQNCLTIPRRFSKIASFAGF